MARITVEDCLQNVPNLFELVMVAAKRARRVANGAEPLLDPSRGGVQPGHRLLQLGELMPVKPAQV